MAREMRSSGHRKRRTLSWLVPISALMVLCAKIKAARCSNKLKTKCSDGCDSRSSWRIPNKKAKRKKGINIAEEDINEAINNGGEEPEQIKGEGEFGDGGVWQRSILMGGKCDPLNFSGIIYYDDKGRKLNELPPRSPRLSPFPAYLSQARA